MSETGTLSASARPTFTKSQVAAYLDIISLPAKYRASLIFTNPALAGSLTHGLPLLSALQKYQIASIPFENLGLHYASPAPCISLDPEVVHSRCVGLKNGRGGRCMEINNLFYHVLLSLGFDVVACGGRVNEAVQAESASFRQAGPRYHGWNHRITIVKFIDEDKRKMENGTGANGATPTKGKKRMFLADAGFGSKVPTIPIELVKGPGHEDGITILNVPPAQESRVRWTNIPDTVDKEQEIWVYEMKYREAKEWVPAYCFTETEFLPRDFEMMSFFTSNNKSSWFTSSIVCLKMLLGKASALVGGDGESKTAPMDVEEGEDEEEEEEVVIGDVTLFNDTVKKRIGGKSEVLEHLETEAQRIAALQKWFCLELTNAEAQGIRNSVTALS